MSSPNIDLKFGSKKEIKKFLIGFSENFQRSFKPKQSTPIYHQVVCVNSECPFTIRFSKRSDGFFHVTKFLQHECEEKNFKMKKSMIVDQIRVLKDQVDDIKPKDCILLMKSHKGIDINYRTAYRSLKEIKNSSETSILNSFDKLKSFLSWNVENNKGTHADIQLEGSVLKTTFLCLNICKHAFVHSLPVITLNRSYFKNSPYILLEANGVNSNNEVFPIAIGLVPEESHETWTYFMDNLNQSLCLYQNEGLVVISDQENGLVTSVQAILPNSVHYLCFDSILKNIKFKSISNYEILSVVNSFSFEGFTNGMNVIRDKSIDVYNYLNQIPHEKWAEYAVTRRRYGHLSSASSEEITSLFRQVENIHPFQLFYTFVNKTYESFRGKYSFYRTNVQSFPNHYFKNLQSVIEEAKYLNVSPTDDENKYRVGKDRMNLIFKIVDIQLRSCTCKIPFYNGIPCQHITACIFKRNENIEDYIEEMFKISSLVEAFSMKFEFCDIELLESVPILPVTKV